MSWGRTPAPREMESGALDLDSAPRRLATPAWRRTPLGVTARLGYFLYHEL